MAEKIINNPSLLPGDLEIELSGGSIIAISGHPLIGSGGGTQSDYVYYPVFDNTTGNVEFHLGTTASNPQPAGGWHISGADGIDGISPKVQINSQTNEWEVSEDGGTTWTSTYVKATGPQGERGIQGEQGIQGVDGKNPVFEIDSTNAHWKWKYAEATSGWTDTQVVASGAVGPQGDPGNDGISPTVSTSVIDGGNRVTFTYDTSSKTKYIDVMSGAPGAPGADGFSPTISTTPITNDPDHPQGGTKVTVTDSTGSEEFKIWNGANGQGATVNLKDGDGIHITQSSNDYTIGVSADYSAMAVTWVQDQNYLKSVPDTYALKTDVEAASANALTEAKSWVNLQNYATKTYANDASANALSEAKTWVGDQGYLIQSDLASYATKTYVETASANAYDKAVAQIPNVTDFITKDVDNLTYYYKKIETSSSSELSTEFAKKVNKPDTSLTDKYLVLRTDTNGAVSGWCDYNDKIYSKSESDGRYMQKNTDSTLSGDGTTNSPLGIDSDNFYELDTAGNYLTSQTSNQKTIISTTPALDNAISRVSTSADVWDTVSAKSTVTVNTANNEIKVNNNANSAISAAIYDVCNTSEPTLIPQRLIVGSSSGDFVTYVNNGKCEGQGTLFFWLESMQPWNPVNE